MWNPWPYHCSRNAPYTRIILYRFKLIVVLNIYWGRMVINNCPSNSVYNHRIGVVDILYLAHYQYMLNKFSIFFLILILNYKHTSPTSVIAKKSTVFTSILLRYTTCITILWYYNTSVNITLYISISRMRINVVGYMYYVRTLGVPLWRKINERFNKLLFLRSKGRRDSQLSFELSSIWCQWYRNRIRYNWL